MSLCCSVLGWGSLDVKFLEYLIDEYDINIDELLSEAEMIGDSNDINIYIYAALSIGANKMREKLIYHFPEYEKEIWNYDVNIYCNYLDSGFDSAFANYNILDLDNEDKAKELLEEIGIDLNENEE